MEKPRRGTRLAAQTAQWGMKRTVVPSHLMWQTWDLDACLAAQCSFGNGIGRTFESILRHGQILSNKHKGVQPYGNGIRRDGDNGSCGSKGTSARDVV